MARKSRVNKDQNLFLSAPQLYHTALYIRVSVYNGGKEDGSTIENQESHLRSYLSGKCGFILSSVYIDNGESGTNFNRSEFERLIGDARAGKINCIIVKDLSRFGRNYIEVGEYLERFFPLWGVRFIAINDNYDSAEPNSSDTLRIHLKNLINDIYARDISRKICPVLRMKQEQGEFIGAWAPYGYQKAENNKHKLVIDEETAPVVRGIFTWRLAGWSYQKIVRELMVQGVPSPSQYRYSKGVIKNEKLSLAIWKPTTVMRILSNRVYQGYLVQGKKRAALWDGKLQAAVPAEDWIVVSGCHEPIVGDDVFEEVQILRNCKGGR